MKKILSFVLVGIMMLSSISVFATETNNIIGGTPAAPETKASELISLGILKGDPDGNMRLDDVITRAEATALITRMNSNNNDILNDYLYRPTFNDIENHFVSLGVILRVVVENLVACIFSSMDIDIWSFLAEILVALKV